MILDVAVELMMRMRMMTMMMMCSTTGLKVAIGMHAQFFVLALQLCESFNFSQGNPADLYETE